MGAICVICLCCHFYKATIHCNEPNLKWLNKYFSNIPLASIARGVINAIVNKMETSVSNATVNDMLALNRAISICVVIEWE